MIPWSIVCLFLVLSVVAIDSTSVSITYDYNDNNAQNDFYGSDYSKDPDLFVGRRCAHLKFRIKRADPENKQVNMYFRLVNLMNRHQHRSYSFPILNKKTTSNFHWSAKGDVSQPQMDVIIRIPCNIPIGYYMIQVGQINLETKKVFTSEPGKRLLILFNPIAKDDPCGLPDQSAIQEYIKNPITVAFHNHDPRVWKLNTWDLKTLKITMWLFQKNNLTVEDYADPVRMSRQVSKITGSLTELDWYNQWTNGSNPWSWSQSLDVLSLYHSKRTRVKYGDNAVNSLLATTLCRVIGIGARVVTILRAAHDSDLSLTVDNYLGSPDSLWDKADEYIKDYHVWTEVYLARIDLPIPYNNKDWNVIDPSPVMRWKDYTCLGPVHKKALMKGVLNLDYDGKYFYSVINSDEIVWNKDNPQEVKVKETINNVGVDFLTKRKGWISVDYDSILHTYKSFKNTMEGRNLMKAVGRALEFPYLYNEDVPMQASMNSFGFKYLHLDQQLWGKPVQIRYQVYNKMPSPIKVKMKFTVLVTSSNYYDPVTVHNRSMIINLEGLQQRNFSLQVEPNKYVFRKDNHPSIRCLMYCSLVDGKQQYNEVAIINTKLPSIIIRKKVISEKLLYFDINFKNPLEQYALKNCYWSMPFANDFSVQNNNFIVGPGKTITPIFKLNLNSKYVVVNLNCDIVKNIIGVWKSF